MRELRFAHLDGRRNPRTAPCQSAGGRTSQEYADHVSKQNKARETALIKRNGELASFFEKLDNAGVKSKVMNERFEYKMAFNAVELLWQRFDVREVDLMRRYSNTVSGTTQQPEEVLAPVLASFGWIHLGNGSFEQKLRTLQSQIAALVIFKPYAERLTDAGVSFFEKFDENNRPPTERLELELARPQLYVPRHHKTYSELSYEYKVLTMATYAFMGFGRGSRGAQFYANDDEAPYNNRDGTSLRHNYAEGDFGFAAVVDSKRMADAYELPWPTGDAKPSFGHTTPIDGRRPEHVVPGRHQYRYLYAYAFNDHSDEERSAAVEAARLAALLNISEVVFMSRRERVWEHYKDDRMRLIDSNMHIVDVYPDAKKSGRPLPYEKN